MANRTPGALVGAVLLLTALAAPAAATTGVDFTGTVALDNCSGAVVRTATAEPTDPALVMSNGHCVKVMAPGEVVADQPSDRTFTLVAPDGRSTLGTLRATTLLYATMTDTDLSFYRLDRTYAEVEAMGGRALVLSPRHPAAHADIRVVSGYWKRLYSCEIDGFAFHLREGKWTWLDSIRYTAECDTVGGTSGSPVVDAASGKVVGVNNTMNESGKRCTRDNPCEVDDEGTVTVRRGVGYGQQTYTAVPCLGAGSVLALSAPGCTLPRPAQLQ
ncbi:S1 family peptidase [Umezawaea tangerina]|uniref:V8-like Glu-specific endopeptidase n=1 Tax=Umezawaea tangerina TaxID=84725 RepID=A0A2T0T9J6_9PSEU|nr:serine protease [Umezawaea tangerina]PRY42336.1 V8-like Glu-specific endopeptidase [Umezawaea tangerina]